MVISLNKQLEQLNIIKCSSTKKKTNSPDKIGDQSQLILSNLRVYKLDDLILAVVKIIS